MRGCAGGFSRGRELSLEAIPDGAERVQILTENFHAPNPDDSFRSFSEQVLEDIIVGGYGAIEVQTSGDAKRPLLLWPVDGSSIRMNLDWDGSPHGQRYLQVTDQSGPKSQIKLDDDELIYIRLNPRTHTPFGLGRLEVAFETINAFLGAHRYASRLASNSVVQYALWLQDLTPEHHERLIRWWQDEIEGTGRVPILSVESKPEVLRFGGGTDADLRLQWQEFLLRVIADAFDLPPFYLGVERGCEPLDRGGIQRPGVSAGDCADGAVAGGASDAGCDSEKVGMERSGVCVRGIGYAGSAGRGADSADSVAERSVDGE